LRIGRGRKGAGENEVRHPFNILATH